MTRTCVAKAAQGRAADRAAAETGLDHAGSDAAGSGRYAAEPDRSAPASSRPARASGELAWCYQVQAGAAQALDEPSLRTLQLKRLNRSLSWARANSPYYRAQLPAQELHSLQELSRLPLMDANTLSANFEQLLCLSPAEVGRIVTLPTSGTTGVPKRIAFSPKDHRFMVEYLAAGMRMLAAPGEAICVLFPTSSGGGLGELICEAIGLAACRAVPHGIPQSFAALAECLWRERVCAAVGFPQHLLAFARWSKHHGYQYDLRSLLLSADNVAKSLAAATSKLLNVEVFAHFGMTETGYGGAVECPLHQGLHLRESDLLVEIVDPISAQPLPDGEWGELVFTTLTREALPLIRYRSGDKARIIPGPCECGSILRRLDNPQGRIDEQPAYLNGRAITMPQLEECLFALPALADFEAGYNSQTGRLSLCVATFESGELREPQIVHAINEMLAQKQPLQPLLPRGQQTSPQSTQGQQSRGQQASHHPRQSPSPSASASTSTGDLNLKITIDHISDFKPYYSAKRFIKTQS